MSKSGKNVGLFFIRQFSSNCGLWLVALGGSFSNFSKLLVDRTTEHLDLFRDYGLYVVGCDVLEAFRRPCVGDVASLIEIMKNNVSHTFL